MSTKAIALERKSLHYPLYPDIAEPDMTKELMKPFLYLTANEGKRIRQHLIKVFQFWVPMDMKKASKVEEIMHYIHNTSLLVDDIQDYSVLRRGSPTAHTVYGIPRTCFSADCAQSRVYDLLDQLDDVQISKKVLKAIADMAAGQGMEIYWREKHLCPTQEEYLQMIYRKTGVLFVLGQTLVNSCSTGKTVDASKLLKTLGMYFQINDDFQNLHNPMYFKKKGFCEDITEGKFSFPIIHAVNNFPKEGETIKGILGEQTYDLDRKKECLAILEKCGSFEYTKKVLKDLKSIIYEEVGKLDTNPFIYALIDKAMVVSQ